MASGSQKRIIQITGFNKQEKKALLKCLFKLNCFFIESKKYRNCTHLIAKKLCKSEKILAACAAGKWVLTKEYIINSAESGRWLDETTYEWGYEIERDTHYSPQMQSAPKRWREELTNSSAPGAFHRWKVVLLFKRGDKRMACIRRVLKAGKATICSSENAEHNITHVFFGDKISPLQNKKYLSEARQYPLYFIGHYLFQNEIKNPKDTQMKHFLIAQETDQVMSKMQLAEMKNVIIKHMYFTVTIKHGSMQTDQLNKCNPEVKRTDWSRGTWSILQGLVEEDLLHDAITELAAGQMCSAPPVQLLHPLLEYVLLGNTDPIFLAKLCHVFYLILHREPPWKSPSMLKYYLDLLQCPICKKGTWSLIEMLVRSCLYCKRACHTVTVSGKEDELRIVHKTLLKFVFDLLKDEVEFLTKSLLEGMDSQHQQVLPQTVLMKTFLHESGTAVLFTKHINILADWVILSHRELNGKNNDFRSEVAGLLNAILGTVVDYWIISGLLMDRNVFDEVRDLAHYLAILCDDFSACQLKTFICAITSNWLQMFVAEAIFKQMCLQMNIAVSTEPLSLRKIVCSYSPALQEIGMRETKIHKGKRKKIGQQPCPESQKTLQMLNGDKQNQVKVLPDLPDSIINRLRAKTEVQTAHTKESYLLAEEVYKRNIKGETALHKACKNNKVERLIQLLSLPGIDINVKDYAGWTPLHEACNHGSTVCVREILERCPEVDLLSQVDGVTPLHDALSNGHVEIGKLLLQHGGPVLLEQRNSHEKLPLDYVQSVMVKEELLNLVYPGESIENFYECREQEFCNQKKELCLFSFTKMLINFCSVYNLSTPLTVTLRAVACSNVLPVMVCESSEMKNTFSGDWLVDMYFKELETFEKLSEFLQEISESMLSFPGEQAKALLAVLETMVEACQCLNLSSS
ncbi:SMC5-SMC6 complex localization factor protein 1 [Sylvia atricapilla]|uniref:SMC5-SMC6 complex localization factor protein 1 n=1 Tax=Sylvia atricapilla TaxID=48155 RepID=UPI0033922A0C